MALWVPGQCSKLICQFTGSKWSLCHLSCTRPSPFWYQSQTKGKKDRSRWDSYHSMLYSLFKLYLHFYLTSQFASLGRLHKENKKYERKLHKKKKQKKTEKAHKSFILKAAVKTLMYFKNRVSAVKS